MGDPASGAPVIETETDAPATGAPVTEIETGTAIRIRIRIKMRWTTRGKKRRTPTLIGSRSGKLASANAGHGARHRLLGRGSDAAPVRVIVSGELVLGLAADAVRLLV